MLQTTAARVGWPVSIKCQALALACLLSVWYLLHAADCRTKELGGTLGCALDAKLKVKVGIGKKSKRLGSPWPRSQGGPGLAIKWGRTRVSCAVACGRQGAAEFMGLLSRCPSACSLFTLRQFVPWPEVSEA